jgi:putrescine transport system permease protein
LGTEISGDPDGIEELPMDNKGTLLSGSQKAPGPLASAHLRLTSFAPYRWFSSVIIRVIDRLGLSGRGLVIGLPYVWLLLFFLFPFVIVFKLSFSEIAIAIPPYKPLWSWAEGIYLNIQLSFESYQLLFEDSLYIKSYLTSIKIAAISTIFALLIGYPMAYGMVRAPKQWRTTLLMLVILPFWTSFLIRVYAWIGILKTNGLLNLLLLKLGIIAEPLTMLNTNFAVYLGIVYSYLPFMILPLYANLEKLDGSLLEAASDLGCRPFKAFWAVTIPLSIPGIVAGCFLVFIPAVGEFVIPDLLGGSDTLMIGKTLWVEFFNNRDWPLASAVAVLLLLILIVPIVLFQKFQERAAS